MAGAKCALCGRVMDLSRDRYYSGPSGWMAMSEPREMVGYEPTGKYACIACVTEERRRQLTASSRCPFCGFVADVGIPDASSSAILGPPGWFNRECPCGATLDAEWEEWTRGGE